MQKNVTMRPEDDTGLPNAAGHHLVRTCPVCGARPPVSSGGVGWKWLAVHMGEHLGFMWSVETGWLKVTN